MSFGHTPTVPVAIILSYHLKFVLFLPDVLKDFRILISAPSAAKTPT